MTPYYSDGLVTIYHGDCREWASPVDAIVTDPPYAARYVESWTWLAGVADRALLPGGWLAAYSGHVTLPAAFAALSGAGLVYRWLLATVYPGGGQFVPLGEAMVMSEWKPIVLFRRPPFGSPRSSGGQFVAGPQQCLHDRLRRGGRGRKDLHPWAQPSSEAVELLAMITAPDATILDPFAGSGSVLDAAKLLGRHAIGIEIDEQHCESAANGCRQEVLGLGA
jgi:site-specific DNA-methyltransferase (adenine-specific)